MVVGQINIKRIAVFKPEDDAPVAGDRNAPQPLQIAFERMQPVARQIEIRRAAGLIQVSQDIRDPARLIGANFAGIPVLKQAPQSTMAERLDQPEECTLYRYRCQRRKSIASTYYPLALVCLI